MIQGRRVASKGGSIHTMNYTKIALMASLVVLAAGANAVVLYSTGFEAPTFTAGSSSVGLDGWVTGSGSGSSQTVSTDYASGGTQSLKYDNSGTLNSFYSVRHLLVANPDPTKPYELMANIRVGGTNGADRITELMFSTGTLGGCYLGISIGGDGKIRAGKTWSAIYSGTAIATAGAGTYADRWLTAKLEIIASTGVGNVRIEGFSDASVYTASFTTVTSPLATHYVNLGSDYNTTTARAGISYFDNVQLASVPEPATLAVLGLGAAALIRRRRK